MNETYELLRTLTTPIVAITSKLGDKSNGMIVNSAMRASLSDVKARVSAYVHKFNFTHDMIFESGRFVLHVLDASQMHLVTSLGFRSGRDGDKLGDLEFKIGKTGLPVLSGCFCHFECRVVNVMDTGGSTLFLGAVEHTGDTPGTTPLTAERLRDTMPEEYRELYLTNLSKAQAEATEMADSMKAVVWRGLSS